MLASYLSGLLLFLLILFIIVLIILKFSICHAFQHLMTEIRCYESSHNIDITTESDSYVQNSERHLS